MKTNNEAVSFLKNKFDFLKRKNSQFSLRSFSKLASLSPGAMSEIFSGKRKLTYEIAKKIAENLKLDPDESASFLSFFRDISGKKIPIQIQQRKLNEVEFKSVGKPLYLALLNLILTKDFKNDIYWIANRLKTTESQITKMIAALKQFGLIRETEGQLQVDEYSLSVRSKDNQTNQAIKNYHIDMLNFAKGSLEHDSTDIRDFTSMVFPADIAKLPKAKELIRKFQDELFALMSEEAPNEVYNLSIQLFPLTLVKSSQVK